MGGFGALYMARAVSTGFNVLAGFFGRVPFAFVGTTFPGVKLSSEAVPVGPPAPDGYGFAYRWQTVAALDPLTHDVTRLNSTTQAHGLAAQLSAPLMDDQSSSNDLRGSAL